MLGAMRSRVRAPRRDEPVWPGRGSERVVFLLDAASGLERKLLRAWIERHRPEGAKFEICAIACARRRGRQRLDPRLESTLAAGDDPLVAPLRIAWLPSARDGRRSVRWGDLLKLGDPRDPDPLRARAILATDEERCRIVAGEPASAAELRERWQQRAATDHGLTLGLAEFVGRQAALALDRAERRLRGARYKVPRFVHEDILARPAFRGSLVRLAREMGRSEEKVLREAARDLREIAATHSPFVIDLVVQLWKSLYTRSYGEVLHYDSAEIDMVRRLSEQHPVVFLPSHKSNLDHGVLQSVLHENGLPPNHTAGGINMNFLPIGPLVRRSGVFFIRRSFKDDPIYKLVLQHYIDYLVEKRFALEWYIEGGRSRSGKLLPPRFGLLAYVVDAYRRARSEDVVLLPVSISYDQISDVGDYAAEQRGGEKEREGFAWFLRVVRRLRRRYGRIAIRFGEPLSLHKALGPPDPRAEAEPDEESLAVQKLAFEVCVRINHATPITPLSLICLALLGRGDRALSAEETREALVNLVDYVRRRRLPTTEELALDEREDVARWLEHMARSDLLVRHDEGLETVYRIADPLAAAYYRNSVIHYFVTGAIAELALLRATEAGVEDPRHEFWDEALRLRDLLKFEFFFAEKELFHGALRRELALHDPAWEKALADGGEAITTLLTRLRPFHAHRILRPFLEAYRVVGDLLEQRDFAEPVDEAALLRDGLALGRQYLLQRRILRGESVSKVLFASALRLARNRGLLDPGGPEQAEARRAFAAALRDAIRRVDAVEALVRARHAGLLS